MQEMSIGEIFIAGFLFLMLGGGAFAYGYIQWKRIKRNRSEGK